MRFTSHVCQNAFNLAIPIARDSNRVSLWRYKSPSIQIAFQAGDSNRPPSKSPEIQIAFRCGDTNRPRFKSHVKLAIQTARDPNRVSLWRYKSPQTNEGCHRGWVVIVIITQTENTDARYRITQTRVVIVGGWWVVITRDPNRVSLWRYKSPASKLAFQVARGVSHCSHQSRSVQKLFPCTFLCRCLYPTAAAHGPRNAIRIATDLAQHRD